MKVSIIIPNWNGRAVLEKCLDSIRLRTEGLGYNYEVIVIDNGSNDGSVEMLRNDYAWAKVIANEKNLGFAKANNQGFEIAKGDYLFMLNNDTLVTENWLENMLAIVEADNKIASLGCVLVSREQYFYQGSPKFGTRERLTVCGAAMLIRKKALLDVGMLDDVNFSPIYGEETDWNYRARNKGYKVMETSLVPIIHIGSHDTTGQTSREYQYVLMNTHRLKAMLYNLPLNLLASHLGGLTLIFINSIRERRLRLLLKAYRNILADWSAIRQERRRRLGG